MRYTRSTKTQVSAYYAQMGAIIEGPAANDTPMLSISFGTDDGKRHTISFYGDEITAFRKMLLPATPEANPPECSECGKYVI